MDERLSKIITGETAMTRVVFAAREFCKYPDGYTLELWTEEKKKMVREQRVAKHRALTELRAAVRALEALATPE